MSGDDNVNVCGVASISAVVWSSQVGHGSDDEADGATASLARTLKKTEAARQRFEEDNFMRLTVSKDERRKRKQYEKEKRRFDPLSDLTSGFAGLDKLAGDGDGDGGGESDGDGALDDYMKAKAGKKGGSKRGRGSDDDSDGGRPGGFAPKRQFSPAGGRGRGRGGGSRGRGGR